MRADLEKRNLLFKTKNTNKQPTSSKSGRGGDKRHNMVEGGRTHSKDAKLSLVSVGA
jgi:hypothetical protein